MDLHVQCTTCSNQAWVNSCGRWCTSGGTPITGCTYSNNGTWDLTMEADFSTDGYLRWTVLNGDAGNTHCLALAGLAAVAGLTMVPVAAQASPSSHAPAAAAVRHEISSRTMMLSARQCATLRKAERGKSVSCLAHEVVHLTARRRAAGPDAAAASTFWKGYAVACGGAKGGPCESWRAELHVQFTTSGDQAWVNGFDPSTWCTTSGTPEAGCGYYNNGTDNLIIENDFSTTGVLDWYVTNGANVSVTASSWANSGAFCVKVNNGCYS